MNTPKKPTKTAAEVEWEQMILFRIDAVETGIAEVRAGLAQLRELLPHLPTKETGR